MWWQFTRSRILFTLVLGLCVAPAHAGKIELAVMPGKVIGAHADFEHQCEKCHVPFDRDAQPRLCLDCHDKVSADVASGQGYHGRLREQQCIACHTEHKGREAKIVDLDTNAFDHTQTDFLLVGKHQNAACEGCHQPGVTYREAPSGCLGCHREDDKHKNAFGERCESCHNETGWNKLIFHHDTDTSFRLLGRHINAGCTECHTGPLYQQAVPTRCNACHGKDDAHRRGLGSKCESCHVETSWQDVQFNHDEKTAFPLRYKHASATCNSCHTPDSIPQKLPRTCFGCHAADDDEKGHKGRYGRQCDSCHDERAFKPSLFRHDRDTAYPLRYSHAVVECDSCHVGASIHGKIDQTCHTCHESDDIETGHRGFYGNRCETCHVEKTFRDIIFEHDRDTSYALIGKHRQAECRLCHQDPPELVDLDTQCYSCHQQEDVHFGTYGRQCDQCHVPDNWRNAKKVDNPAR